MIRFALVSTADLNTRPEKLSEIRGIVAASVASIEGKLVASVDSPGDSAGMQKILAGFADKGEADIVLTTGGTGFAPADFTPEATRAVCDREVPGIAELMRSEGYKLTKRAVLSRQYCGLRGRTLYVNLPGSPKGAKQSLDAILEIFPMTAELFEMKADRKG